MFIPQFPEWRVRLPYAAGTGPIAHLPAAGLHRDIVEGILDLLLDVSAARREFLRLSVRVLVSLRVPSGLLFVVLVVDG